MVFWYFAYGSNMNPERVRQRRMHFDVRRGGVLDHFELVFNKRSVRYPGAASANVEERPGARTEGMVYRLLHPDQILSMDPFEGYPLRYDRQVVPVACGSVIVQAWVYIANPEYVAEGLLPAQWYLDHLLAARDHLSAAYCRRLEAVQCLPDSRVEPV